MAKADPTRSIQYAIRHLIPLRPTAVGNRRLVRFFGLVIVSLLVVILAIDLLSAIGASKETMILVALSWMALLCGGSPVVILLSARDQDRLRSSVRLWERDPRRIAVERLALELGAGRVPSGLAINDILTMDVACSDWRQSRDALEALMFLRGDTAALRDDLHHRLDEAMLNLLAEAGAGSQLGPSPFLMERARKLFHEVGAEANAIGKAHTAPIQLRTDNSLESLRSSLDHLREVRQAREDLVETLFEKIHAEGA